MFTIEFIKKFGVGLFYAGPIVLFLIALIGSLGLLVGKREGWKPIDSLYYAFITATTVGYGDYHPKTTGSKFIAIGIAFVRLLLTGIVVAIGVQAAMIAFEQIYVVPAIAN